MYRRALRLLARPRARKEKAPFSPLVPRVHYWEVPEIMDKIRRLQPREPELRPMTVDAQHLAKPQTSPTATPAAVASSAAPLTAALPEPTEVHTAAMADTWVGMVQAARKANVPLHLPLKVPRWTETYFPILLAVAVPTVGMYRLFVGSHLGAIEFFTVMPVALPFRAFRYCTTLTLTNPKDRREEWLLEAEHVPLFPMLPPVRTRFRLADVNWAVAHKNVDTLLQLQVNTPSGRPLGAFGRMMGLDVCVLDFQSKEQLEEVRKALISLRGQGKGLDQAFSAMDDADVQRRQQKRDYFLMIAVVAAVNLVFIGYIVFSLSSNAIVKEKGYFGALKHLAGWG